MSVEQKKRRVAYPPEALETKITAMRHVPTALSMSMTKCISATSNSSKCTMPAHRNGAIVSLYLVSRASFENTKVSVSLMTFTRALPDVVLRRLLTSM